jgi:hypothetical protein
VTGKEGEGEEMTDSWSKEGAPFSIIVHLKLRLRECTYVHNVPFESVGPGIVRSLVKVLLEDSIA